MMNSRLLKNGKIILIFILKVEVICIYAHSKILKIDFRDNFMEVKMKILTKLPHGERKCVNGYYI